MENIEKNVSESSEAVSPEVKPRVGRPPKAVAEKSVEASEKAEGSGDMKKLLGLVESLQSQISDMKKFPQGKNRLQKRTKEHMVTLREFSKDDEAIGLVTRLHSVREVKDRTEAKKLMGVCTIEYMVPESDSVGVDKSVDYLSFLNEAPKVMAKVLSERTEQRFEVDPRKGGGGIGALYKQGPNNEYVADSQFDFEVGYVDHFFTLEVLEGKFAGKVIEVDERAVNL